MLCDFEPTDLRNLFAEGLSGRLQAVMGVVLQHRHADNLLMPVFDTLHCSVCVHLCRTWKCATIAPLPDFMSGSPPSV